MKSVERKRLAELQAMALKINKTLGREAFQIPELMPGVDEAQRLTVRLLQWLDEMVWIAERELKPRLGRPPRGD